MARQSIEGMTKLLNAGSASGQQALNQVITLAYAELCRVAGHERRRVFAGTPGLTLQGTDVVHETWAKLREAARDCQNGDHFFGVARIVIRQFLIDYARKRMSDKRGGGKRGVNLEAAEHVPALLQEKLPLEYAELLEEFGEAHPRQAEVFSLCRLAGFTQQEAAMLLNVSLATLERDLSFARAWWKMKLVEQD